MHESRIALCVTSSYGNGDVRRHIIRKTQGKTYRDLFLPIHRRGYAADVCVVLRHLTFIAVVIAFIIVAAGC